MGWNVGERKPHKAEGDCGFSNPEGANSARSAYCLLSEVACYYNVPLTKFLIELTPSTGITFGPPWN